MFIPAISPLLMHLKKETQIYTALSKPFHGIILRYNWIGIVMAANTK
jgi:hypothetical protein